MAHGEWGAEGGARAGGTHVARVAAVDVWDGPAERDGMSAVGAHDGFRRAGGARRVQQVERVVGVDGHRVVRARVHHFRLVVELSDERVGLWHHRRALHEHHSLLILTIH